MKLSQYIVFFYLLLYPQLVILDGRGKSVHIIEIKKNFLQKSLKYPNEPIILRVKIGKRKNIKWKHNKK
jgi:hypothetical protein